MFTYIGWWTAKNAARYEGGQAVIRHEGISREGIGRADISGERTGTNNRDKQEDHNRPIPIKKQ